VLGHWPLGRYTSVRILIEVRFWSLSGGRSSSIFSCETTLTHTCRFASAWSVGVSRVPPDMPRAAPATRVLVLDVGDAGCLVEACRAKPEDQCSALFWVVGQAGCDQL
jgi:hypothetical protein